ncbi:MAG: hypothetical protein JWP85_50 [Rhodoglobus sp.]|nr:hypothetical protein [Rhodoglobus sp.]
MELFHYYERSIGPFRNLSDLAPDAAAAVQAAITQRGTTFAARRPVGYLERRRELEQLARDLFVAQGGKPERDRPHYMVVGACPFLAGWYDDPAHAAIALDVFDPSTLSFTYGDLFPTFSDRVDDGREYRRRVYTVDGIREVIARHGLPQEWNPDGAQGPERYVEVQVWAEIPGTA